MERKDGGGKCHKAQGKLIVPAGEEYFWAL